MDLSLRTTLAGCLAGCLLCSAAVPAFAANLTGDAGTAVSAVAERHAPADADAGTNPALRYDEVTVKCGRLLIKLPADYTVGLTDDDGERDKSWYGVLEDGAFYDLFLNEATSLSDDWQTGLLPDMGKDAFSPATGSGKYAKTLFGVEEYERGDLHILAGYYSDDEDNDIMVAIHVLSETGYWTRYWELSLYVDDTDDETAVGFAHRVIDGLESDVASMDGKNALLKPGVSSSTSGA